jgi:hypothetical protein
VSSAFSASVGTSTALPSAALAYVRALTVWSSAIVGTVARSGTSLPSASRGANLPGHQQLCRWLCWPLLPGQEPCRRRSWHLPGPHQSTALSSTALAASRTVARPSTALSSTALASARPATALLSTDLAASRTAARPSTALSSTALVSARPATALSSTAVAAVAPLTYGCRVLALAIFSSQWWTALIIAMVKPLSDAFVWDSFYLTHAGLKEEGVGVHNADSSTPANELSMKG